MTLSPHASVAEAAASGDRLAVLLALRRTLAQAIDDGPSARDLSPLVRQLSVVVGELAGLEPFVDSSPLDHLIERRRARRLADAGANGSGDHSGDGPGDDG